MGRGSISLPTLSLMGRGDWKGSHPAQQLCHWDGAIDGLAGDHLVSGFEGVPDPELDRVHPERRGEPVHLRLVRVAVLDRAEPAHRPARRVVGVDDQAVDRRVRAAIRPDREAGRVRDHGGRARGVRAAVEHDARPDVDQRPIAVRSVLVRQAARVAVHVADEGLRPQVGDLHGATRPQREHARVRLHRQVFACAEGAADAGHRQSHLLLGKPKDVRELLLVDVQPLGRDVQVDAPLAIRDREPRLGPEGRLVLHADLVLAVDDDVGRRRLVAAADLDVAEQVAVRMQVRRPRCKRLLGVDDGLQHLVLDAHRGRGPAGLLGMVGRDERHRLAPVADKIARQHGLVLDLEPVHLLAPHVLVREHCPHAGHGASLGDVDVDDPRVRVRAAHRRAPQHPLGPQVRRVGEGAAHLGAPVWAADALADPHLAAICTASMIVP